MIKLEIYGQKLFLSDETLERLLKVGFEILTFFVKKVILHVSPSDAEI